MDVKDNEKALWLLEQLGSIDEEILNECSAAYPIARRQKKRIRAVILAAAVWTLLASLLFTAVSAFMIRSVSKGHGANDGSSTAGNSEPENSQNWLTDETQIHEAIFAGTPSVIFKKAGDSEYLCKPLDPRTYDTILKKWSSPAGMTTATGGEDQVWVTDGKGLVITPYLKESPGNMYFGTLFEYSPEVLPNDTIREILGSLDE